MPGSHWWINTTFILYNILLKKKKYNYDFNTCKFLFIEHTVKIYKYEYSIISQTNIIIKTTQYSKNLYDMYMHTKKDLEFNPIQDTKISQISSKISNGISYISIPHIVLYQQPKTNIDYLTKIPCYIQTKKPLIKESVVGSNPQNKFHWELSLFKTNMYIAPVNNFLLHKWRQNNEIYNQLDLEYLILKLNSTLQPKLYYNKIQKISYHDNDNEQTKIINKNILKEEEDIILYFWSNNVSINDTLFLIEYSKNNYELWPQLNVKEKINHTINNIFFLHQNNAPIIQSHTPSTTIDNLILHRFDTNSFD